MRAKEKLPRGIRRRGESLVACFALADGTIERRSVGPVSVKYAKQQRQIWMREVAEGRYARNRPKVKCSSWTVADLWEFYLRDYNNSGGKAEGWLKIIWNHLRAMFTSVPGSQVSTDLVNRYIESRRAQGVQNGTINRETTILRAMFNCGARVTTEGGNPMVERVPAFPPRLKENEPRKGFVTDKQYAQLKANCEDLWLRALIAVAYTFGFRKSELLNLRVRQVDLMDRWIDLEPGTTKNDEPRKVRMTSEVFELVRACVRSKGPDDFVFTREDGRRVIDPRDDWYELCVKSALGRYVLAKQKDGKESNRYVGLNLHDFRRSAIRNMTRRGVDDKTAMRISGHKTFSVFQRYNIVDEGDLIEASRLIERRLETDTNTDTSNFADLQGGAGEGNRTLTSSLGS